MDEAKVADEMAETFRRPAMSSIRTPPSAPARPRALLRERPEIPVVALSTAHPAKFPDAVERAQPASAASRLSHMADLMERKESFTVLSNDQAAVERVIRERARAVKGVAA